MLLQALAEDGTVMHTLTDVVLCAKSAQQWGCGQPIVPHADQQLVHEG